jgi:deoxycytidine triphosphate deaminase
MIHILGSNSNSDLTAVQEGDSQPNAIDLRLDKVFAMNNAEFVIDNESKKHRGTYEWLPDADGWYHLNEGTYEVVMENIIHVGPDEAGWVITRSTLNRNGVFITSGLYDSGYHGVMAGAMHVRGGPVKIKKGTRVAQFLLFKAEALSEYNGSYGLKSEHDKKYTQGAIQ